MTAADYSWSLDICYKLLSSRQPDLNFLTSAFPSSIWNIGRFEKEAAEAFR